MSTISSTVGSPLVPSTKCSFCGEIARYGGFHRGDPDIVLCQTCLINDGLHILGYILGDAILDSETNLRRNSKNILQAVRSVVSELEKEIFRALVNQLTIGRNGKA